MIFGNSYFNKVNTYLFYIYINVYETISCINDRFIYEKVWNLISWDFLLLNK